MKTYIEFNTTYYKNVCPDAESVLMHMFCVNGNGVKLDNKGYLRGNYKGKEPYEFSSPKPLTSLYPWSKTRRYQPFRDLAGCRDVGFKEAAKHFIECLKLTDESIEYTKEWKDHIKLIEKILLKTPTITDKYAIDDMDKFLSDIENDKTTSQAPQDGTDVGCKNSVDKRWFFDVQWSDCPKEVETEVKSSWGSYELGNDNYFWTATVNEELFDDYPKIYFWLKHKGVPDGEKVIVHWWW